jgi:hypothetical protein
VSREAEPRILWIGYVSRALASDNSPTVTQVALDARRIDPQPIPGSHALWAKVCVDETGAVTSVRPDLVTAAEAQEPLIAHLRAWKFQPFELDGIAAPVCAMMRAGAVGELDEIVPPVYTDEQGRGITVSATAIGERIDGNISITLDDEDKIVLGRMKGNTLYGKARMCLGTDGHVTGAWTVRKSGFPRYDAKWLAALKGWRYGPQSRPVCSYVDVIYTLK